MTSNKRDRAEALAEMGLTPPDFALFTAVHYGLTAAPDFLPDTAAREDYNPDGPVVTEGECRVALAACLAKGWLQVIDEPGLVKITDELREGGVLGPIYGLPEVGGVDFTPAGAELWQRLYAQHDASRPSQPPFAFTDVVHSKTSHYYRTRTAAVRGIEEATEFGGDIIIAGPSSIGPWRAQWWRRFADGYRIDIEERQKWQGRGGGGGGAGCFMSYFPRQGADLKRLQHVLDCHNVMLMEWLLLATMEHRGRYEPPSHFPRWVAKTADWHFGVTASEDECRMGLDACLGYGWLRIVDQHAVDEVEALLRDEPAIMPLGAKVVACGGVDFTPCGAALYRMLAAEWLGPDWEDGLSVEKELYREEHRYCEAAEGLRGVAHEYAAKGEVVRASRIVPIGPWCVYWWERFPAGYRLELEIGEA